MLNRNETITIQGGLGPIQTKSDELKLSISPLTILVGEQGSGKSLLSQYIYFFRDAQYLLSRGSIQDSENTLVASKLAKVRSGNQNTKNRTRVFLTSKQAKVEYRNVSDNSSTIRKIGLYQSGQTARLLKPFSNEVKDWLQEWNSHYIAIGGITPKALYVPAERLFISRFIDNPSRLFNPSLNTPTIEFLTWLQGNSLDIHELWKNEPNREPEIVKEINDLMTVVLGGKSVFSKRGEYSRTWEWMPNGSQRSHSIDLTSSGQMALWPLISIVRSLFGIPDRSRPTCLHIEEPEAHLSPLAQMALVKMIALLINQGFRLLITTHSSFILSAINHLISTQQIDNDKVSAYLAVEQTFRSIKRLDGLIDESPLQKSVGQLEIEHTRLIHQLHKKL